MSVGIKSITSRGKLSNLSIAFFYSSVLSYFLEGVGFPTPLFIMRIVDRVREIVSPIVEAEGLELLEVEYIKGKRRSILRLIVDKVGGVTIGECKRLSERVETKLDVTDPIPSSYRLEVSSPGVDRPLRTEKEFAVKKGRMVKIKIAKPICGKQEFIGRIEGVQEGRVQIMTEGGRITIPIDSIMNAFVQVQF